MSSDVGKRAPRVRNLPHVKHHWKPGPLLPDSTILLVCHCGEMSRRRYSLDIVEIAGAA